MRALAPGERPYVRRAPPVKAAALQAALRKIAEKKSFITSGNNIPLFAVAAGVPVNLDLTPGIVQELDKITASVTR